MEHAIIPINLKGILLRKDFKIRLHSRFASTTNFLINNKIVAFQDGRTPLTPFSIKLIDSNKQINKLTVLDVDEILSKINRQYLDLKVKPLINFDIQNFKKNLGLFLKQKIGKSEIVNSLFTSEFKNPFTKLLNLSPIDNLEKFIGLGAGLTPAGDDFIIGYLLGLVIQDQFNESLKNRMFIAINKQGATNDISKQYLLAALDRNFNQYICEMLYKFHNNNFNSSFEKISSIGASSGLDLLAGLYLSIN